MLVVNNQLSEKKNVYLCVYVKFIIHFTDIQDVCHIIYIKYRRIFIINAI